MDGLQNSNFINENLKRKNMKFLAAFFLILFLSACSNSGDKNITTNELLNDIHFGMEYSAADKILTEKYNLKDGGELEQNQHSSKAKVMVYTGGHFNNIPVNSWIITLFRDRIYMLTLNFHDENRSTVKNWRDSMAAQLDKAYPRVNMDVNSEIRWTVAENNKKIANILLTHAPTKDGFALLISRIVN